MAEPQENGDEDGAEYEDDPVTDTCKALALAAVICQAKLDKSVPWATKAAKTKISVPTLLAQMNTAFIDRLCANVMSPSFRGTGMCEVRVSLFRLFCQAVYVFNHTSYKENGSSSSGYSLHKAMNELDQMKAPVDRAIDVLKWRNDSTVTLAIAKIVSELAEPMEDIVSDKEIMYTVVLEEQHPCLTLDSANLVPHSESDHARCRRYRVPSYQMVLEIESRYYSRMQESACGLVRGPQVKVDTTLTNEIIRLFIKENSAHLKPELYLDIANIYIPYKFPSHAVALLGDRLRSHAPKLIHGQWNKLIGQFKTPPRKMLKDIAQGKAEPWLEELFVLASFACIVRSLHQLDVDFTTLSSMQESIDALRGKSPDSCLILVSDEKYYIYQSPDDIEASAKRGQPESEDAEDGGTENQDDVWALEPMQANKRRRVEETRAPRPSVGRFVPMKSTYDAIRFWISAKQPRGLMQKLAFVHARDAVDNHREKDLSLYLTILNAQ